MGQNRSEVNGNSEELLNAVFPPANHLILSIITIGIINSILMRL